MDFTMYKVTEARDSTMQNVAEAGEAIKVVYQFFSIYYFDVTWYSMNLGQCEQI
jgi:hypothetical protein